jgi:hypothetical protein
MHATSHIFPSVRLADEPEPELELALDDDGGFISKNTADIVMHFDDTMPSNEFSKSKELPRSPRSPASSFAEPKT